MDIQNLINETSKSISHSPRIYDDTLRPTAKSIGKTINLIPRAVNAALSGVEEWILKQEYSVEKTKLLLHEKLKDRNTDNIVPPEHHIAIPVLQSISYCMDSNELRNLYANLLANSMDSSVKDNVHPSFIEIIRQLSPFDANLLKSITDFLYKSNAIPIVKVRIAPNKDSDYGVDIINHILGPDFNVTHDNFNKFTLSIDNLIRLNLISVDYHFPFVDKTLYEDIKDSCLIHAIEKVATNHCEEYPYVRLIEGVLSITYIGRSFAEICID